MKKNVLYVLAIVIAISASAFTFSGERHEKQVQLWYEFTGSDPDNPLHYQMLGNGSQAPACNAQTSNRCAVKAVSNTTYGSDYPQLTDPGIEIRNKTSN
jgi:hypothetical protein